VLLWWGTFLLAGLLVHGALGNAESQALAAALLAGAVALPLTMLGYTIRTNGDDFNSHILVPAIGPVVIAVLMFDYVEYNQRIEEAFSAQLISTDLVQLLDVKWAGASGDTSSYLSGRVSNRSPHQLTGMSLEVALYAGSEQIASMTAKADLDVPPGEQRKFKVTAKARPAGPADPMDCRDERAAPAPAQAPRGSPREFECIYRLERTRGEEVF
jgi:hypothetical protein